MEATLQELAALIAGRVAGPPDADSVKISRTAVIELADSSSITFVRDAQHWTTFLASPAAAAIVSGFEPGLEKPTIVVADAEASFATVVSHFRPPMARPAIGISPQAVIHPSAQIADGVDIYPLAYVGAGSVIESGSVIMPGVCILENCRIGPRVRISPTRCSMKTPWWARIPLSMPAPSWALLDSAIKLSKATINCQPNWDMSKLDRPWNWGLTRRWIAVRLMPPGSARVQK